METFRALALGIALLSIAAACAEQAHTDQSPQDATTIRNDVNTQAAIVEAVDKMKAADADQGAAQNRYSQTVDAAKAEHEIAIGKCEALSDEAKSACKERADDALKLAKSEAQKALETHTSVQP